MRRNLHLPFSCFRLRRHALNLAIGLVLLTVLIFQPATGRSTVSWRGDFETGTLSQWDNGVQQKDPSRVTVVNAPLRQGRYAARFEVRPGDNNVAGSGTGERAEVLITNATTDATEGREAYWAWSTYFPTNFAAPMGGWNAFTQFHHSGTTGQTNMHFAVSDMKALTLRVMGGDLNAPTRKDFVLASLQKGSWYDFVFHVKWSSNPSVGFVELWVNGNRVVPKTFTPTLYAGMTAYAKQGYYRAAYDGTTVVYQDGMRKGSSYEEVAAEFPAGGSPPSFAVTSSIATGSTLAGNVQWTATPSGVTASSVTFSIDGSPAGTDTTAPYTLALDTTKLTDGTHAFRVDATATDGSKASASAQATVSNGPSWMEVQQNLVDGQTLKGSLAWTATTSGKTASRVDFSVDGAIVGTDTTAPYSMLLDTTKLTNASHTFGVEATATDGSQASTSALATVSNEVATSLKVEQNLVDGQTVSGSLAWTATTSGKTVARVDFSVDGQLVATDNTAPYALTYDTNRLANDAYPFAVKAVATDGTTATATAAVKVVNSRASTFTVTQNVSDSLRLAGPFKWSVTAAGGRVANVAFFVDGAKIEVDPNAPYETNVNTRKLPDGQHTFKATALAEDGSIASTSADATVANQATAPAPSPRLEVSQSLVSGQSLSGFLTWTATTSGQRAARVEFFVDGRLSWTEQDSPYVYGGDGGELDTRKIADGSHTLEVKAYAADRESAKATATVSVSNDKGSSGAGSGNKSDDASSDPTVVSSIRDGQTISGLVTWAIDPRGFTVSRMEFFIDSKLMWTERLAPYAYGGDGRQLDTRTLTRGKHKLEVRAVGTDGSVHTIKLSVTVA